MQELAATVDADRGSAATADQTQSGTRLPADRGRTRGFFIALFLGLSLLQLLVYARSFDIHPAGDDWVPLNEIRRGDREGPGVFFLRSAQFLNYRPLQSLAIWAAGQAPESYRYASIRLLDFGCMWAFTAAIFLWLGAMPLGRAATAIAGTVLVLHPALPAPLASVDGFGSLAASAAVWLGAWCVLRWAHRPAVAAVLAVACFIVGAGFKEFVFTLVPLCGLTALCFGGRGRWKLAVAVCLPLCLTFAGLLLVRRFTIPPGANQGFAYLALGPLHLLTNAAQLAIVLLFPGNSIWVYFHRTPVVLAACAAVGAVVATVILWGIRRWAQSMEVRVRMPGEPVRSADAPPARQWPEAARAARPVQWIFFLLLSLVAASFPQNVIYHMSEMYAAPLVGTIALACGLAAEGWMRPSGRGIYGASVSNAPVRRWPAVAAACVAVGAAVAAITTIVAKVEGLRHVGQQAEAMLRQVMSQFPPDARNKRIAVLFLRTQLPADRTYSVFHIGDDGLVPEYTTALAFERPGMGLQADVATVDRPVDFPSAGYDAVLVWDAPTRQFRTVVASGSK